MPPIFGGCPTEMVANTAWHAQKECSCQCPHQLLDILANVLGMSLVCVLLVLGNW